MSVGCAQATDETTGGEQDLTASGDPAAAPTPEEAAARVAELLPDTDYDGKTPAGQSCEVVIELFEEFGGKTNLNASIQEVSSIGELGEKPLFFEVHPELRGIESSRPATPLSSWNDQPDALSFTVGFRAENNKAVSADVAISKDSKGGLSMKATLEGRSVQCDGLVARPKHPLFG